MTAARARDGRSVGGAGPRPTRRRSRLPWALLCAPGAATTAVVGAAAQDAPVVVERPVPGPLLPPPSFRAALEAGTRSADGSPGPAHWQQRASYTLDARLDPAAARVSGRGTIRYENRSPDRLPVVLLHLYQNLHAPGAMRNEPQEVTGGVELLGVRVGGRDAPPVEAATAPPAHQVDGTILAVALPEPLEPGASTEIEVEWAFTVPESGAGRMGHSDREVFLMAYWFPKVAVYDDLVGWDAEPYLGNAEFHDGFGDYEVSVTVPTGWTVMATGELLNGPEVFGARTLERLALAATADTVVRVVTAEDRAAGGVTASGESGELTYRFRAPNVRDFAFTASNVQRWDATSAAVPGGGGEGAPGRVLIHGFWREDRAPLWAEQALYAKHAVEHHSRYTGMPYPWPHMTSVEGDGIIGGGMEFPMLTLIASYEGRGAEELYAVTSHEIAHMWIPMIVGTNERRHAWMDEGATTFLENESRVERFGGSDPHGSDRDVYLQIALAGLEQEIMRHGDYYEPGPGYGIASYPKPAAVLVTLRALIGEEAFARAYRAFVEEWAYRHPTPWDLFNTFERFAGRDLDWFWQSFFRETWHLDHAVAGVETRDGAPVVVIADRGWAVLPVRVTIETTAGGTIEREISESAWLSGRTRVELPLPAGVGEVTSVRLSPELGFLDVNPADNEWRAGAGR